MVVYLPRRGASLIEVILVIGIILALSGLLVPAVMRGRESASKTACSNQLRQIGLALQQYHGVYGSFPPGMTHEHGIRPSAGSLYHGLDVDPFPFLHWHARLLPYLEQESLWTATVKAFAESPRNYRNPPHIGRDTTIPLFQCPSEDPNAEGAKPFPPATSFMGVSGTKTRIQNGVLFLDSHVRLTDITDGATNTLIVGERPPNRQVQVGQWYGVIPLGYNVDAFLGVTEEGNPSYIHHCPFGPYQFELGSFTDRCSLMHFWSVHSGGGHFAFADGSVHFLPYSAAPILPALATRARGESVAVAY